MIKCELCKRKFKSLRGLSNHIWQVHPIYTIQKYYDEFLSIDGNNLCSKCGSKLKDFVSLPIGYSSNLCVKCASKLSRNKSKQTCIDRYGVSHPMYLQSSKDKTEETNLKKFGHTHWKKSDKLKKKSQENLLKKYGVTNISYLDNIKEKRKQTHIKNYSENNLPIYLERLNLDLISNYECLTVPVTFQCKKCGKKFKDTFFNVLQRVYACPNCRVYTRSLQEIEIGNFLDQLNIGYISNTCDIIPPKELDIYIPSKQVAIEFDGLYWHSNVKLKDKNYHLNKTLECEKKNIQLIHIFEDEWMFKQEIVKSRLKQILNVSKSVMVQGRNCIIKKIGTSLKNKFLEKHHILGKDKSKVKLGAFYNGELISVMTFSQKNFFKDLKTIKGVWKLNRYCSNPKYCIPGIAFKLLTYFKRNYDWKKIISYADRRWSQGRLHYSLGFKLQSIIKPNYWYIKGTKRIDRFEFRKNINNSKYLSKKVIKKRKRFDKIWDCGNLKFIIN